MAITRSEISNRERAFPATPFRLFEDFFNDWAIRSMERRRTEGWTPAVDIVEKDGNLHLMISLAGLNEKDIELKVEGQVLTVKGERKSKDAEGYSYRQQECRCGAFSRSFTLPDSADLENIKADYRNGILDVMVPPKPEVKPRIIKINSN